jgi:HTH-type transcriptional regulator/antitoxin HigA
MRNYRTIDDITAEYLCKHPDEIDDYTTELFEEYAQDRNIAALLSSLRIVCRVKGVSFVRIRKGRRIFPW